MIWVNIEAPRRSETMMTLTNIRVCKRPESSDLGIFALDSAIPIGLTHGSGHLEDRQIHGYHQPTYGAAKEDHEQGF